MVGQSRLITSECLSPGITINHTIPAGNDAQMNRRVAAETPQPRSGSPHTSARSTTGRAYRFSGRCAPRHSQYGQTTPVGPVRSADPPVSWPPACDFTQLRLLQPTPARPRPLSPAYDRNAASYNQYSRVSQPLAAQICAAVVQSASSPSV